MKFTLLTLVFILSGCAQLMNGQEQPVRYSDKFKDAYYTSCGGAVETWSSCDRKALKKCPSGYTVLEKSDDTTGVNKQLSFKCNK